MLAGRYSNVMNALLTESETFLSFRGSTVFVKYIFYCRVIPMSFNSLSAPDNRAVQFTMTHIIDMV